MLSVPKRLRYPLQADIAVQNLALHLFLSAVENCAPPDQRFKTSPPHRFGRLHPPLQGLNPHLHFHCVVVDGVFEAGADVDLPVRFHEASPRRADEPASSCRRYPPNAKHLAECVKNRFSALPSDFLIQQ